MTWILFKFHCKKIWSWLKHNWKVPAILLWTVVVYLASRGNTQAMEDVLEAKKRAHKEEIDILNKTHSSELERIKNVQQQYVETINNLEAKFKEENKQLSQSQKKQIKKVVTKSKGDPSEIKKQIEKEFGIKFE